MTEEVPESENKKNKVSTLYWKCDFSLPVMVPLLETGRVITSTGKLCVWVLTFTLLFALEEALYLAVFFHLKVLSPILGFHKKIIY
jgi:hypothetical protein